MAAIEEVRGLWENAMPRPLDVRLPAEVDKTAPTQRQSIAPLAGGSVRGRPTEATLAPGNSKA